MGPFRTQGLCCCVLLQDLVHPLLSSGSSGHSVEWILMDVVVINPHKGCVTTSIIPNNRSLSLCLRVCILDYYFASILRPKAVINNNFGASRKVILVLAGRALPRAMPPPPKYILRALTQMMVMSFICFLARPPNAPHVMIMPCSCRGKPRHISSNARRFQKGA
jgi:hypothetical protein